MSHTPHIAYPDRPPVRSAAADRVADLLVRHLDPGADGLAAMSVQSDDGHSHLDGLATIFRLTGFERDLLAWCAAVDIDAAMAEATVELSGGPARPTFRLAMAVLPEPHWSATGPSGALRHWMLLTLSANHHALDAPLSVDEGVFNYLVGLPFSDGRLLGWLVPVTAGSLSSAHRETAMALARRLESDGPGRLHAHLRGSVRACEAVAALALEMGGFAAIKLFAADVPSSGNELREFSVLWSRLAVLSRSGLILRIPDDSSVATSTISRLMDAVWGPVLVIGGGKESTVLPGVPVIEIGAVTREECATLFRIALGDSASRSNGQIERTTAHFELDVDDISAIASEFELLSHETGSDALWDISRRHARPDLGALAERIDSRAGWGDIVLPSAQIRTLREIGSHVRNRFKVYETWGFSELNSRGLGISALFHGPSGTGKTLAAEVLANELSVDLYRIDLSAVVSKYIGETEKNLSKIFDAAESAPVILLFDEADALFGKRSEVRDSHDRYANLEVSYLLQRVEAFRGLAILTTNMKSALDQAFLRRIRFVVNFPFPDQQQRAEIWKRVFPQKAPQVDLDFARLARLNVAGGHIRNIAMNAAFRAAEEESDITMGHLLQAARAEYDKLDRPLSETEFRGWST